MITISINANYTLRMGNDCTLYVYNERERMVYESDPNASMSAIIGELQTRRQDGITMDDAAYYLTSDIVLALEEVEGFAGGVHPDTIQRYNQMKDAPSWQLLQWLL